MTPVTSLVVVQPGVTNVVVESPEENVFAVKAGTRTTLHGSGRVGVKGKIRCYGMESNSSYEATARSNGSSILLNDFQSYKPNGTTTLTGNGTTQP